MHPFSKRYIKMCEKAAEIQSQWKDILEEWDEYLPKGDYGSEFSSEVHLAGLSKQEIEDLVDKNIWLPLEYQIKERLFKSFRTESIRKLVEGQYVDFIKDEERIRMIRKYFESFEIINVLALMFVMDKYHKKQWNVEKEDWVKNGQII